MGIILDYNEIDSSLVDDGHNQKSNAKCTVSTEGFGHLTNICNELFQLSTLLHSERPELYTIMSFLSTIGLFWGQVLSGYTLKGK